MCKEKIKTIIIIIHNRQFYITLKCPEGNFNHVNIICSLDWAETSR